MKPGRRHRLRRIWFMAGGLLAVLVIALAVLMALAQLLLPLVAHYPKQVARVLSEQLHQPVSFDAIQGHWQPSGPLLVLHRVRIGGSAGQPALVLPTARVKLDFGALVWPSRHWVNLRLSGLKLQLQRDASGHWHVAGFGVAGEAPAGDIHLGDLPGNLWLDDLELDIDDSGSGQHFRVRAGPVRVSNGGDELRFAGLVHRGDSPQALKIIGEVHDGGVTGQLYLAADDVDLGAMFAGARAGSYAIDSGRGDLALWLAWNQRRLTTVTAKTDLADLAVQGPAGTAKAPKLRGLVQYRRDGDRATLRFAPGQQGAARVDITGLGTSMRVNARAHDLDPGGWLTLASLAPEVPVGTGRWLAAAEPHVRLASARLLWSKARGIESVDVHFDHLGFAAAEKRPGLDRLHGVLRGDAEALSLSLPKQPVTLDYRPVFRQPIALSALGGDVALWRTDAGWHVDSAGVDFTGQGIQGQLRGSVLLPAGGKAPVLDLYAALSRLDIVQAKRFWPVTAMSKGTVDWLDRGLVSGTVKQADVVLHGSMADWPFTHHKGRFEARADISGLTLDYQPGWPRASDVSVQASFVDNGMLAVATSGKVQGVKVERAVASIPDFGKAELILSAQGSGKGGDLMQFVRTSPIGKPHADVLDGLKLGGQGDFDFSMVVPLSKRAEQPFTLAGSVNLQGGDLDAADWKLHLGGLAGPLKFDNHGLEAHGLHALFHGQPVTLDLQIGRSTGHPAWPVKVAAHGNFTMAQLASGYDELQPLVGVASGSAPFDIGFHIDRDAANAVHATQVLSVTSSLQGMALDLPAPLDKPAQGILPLDVQLGFPVSGGDLKVTLGNLLHARARLPTQAQPAVVDVMLGGSAPVGQLPAQGIRIRGQASRVDVSGWVQHALSSSAGTQQDVPSVDVDVVAANAIMFGHDFNKLRVELHPEKNQLKLSVDGAEIKGYTTVPLHDMGKRGIVARFERLYWPSPEDSATAASAPASAASVAGITPQQAANVGVAPSSLPPLHVWVGDLRFGAARLGQARLESWPTAQGMHIDMLRTQSESVHMAASGNWNGTATDSSTHMVFTFTAENLGRMLDAFGFDGLITGGETRAHMDATWPGAPSSFELANVEGTLEVNIGRGRIPEVKPGVGRLFGLMSIVELPRRLSLDFGDVFGKGFGFDSIKGHFRFHDGNAWTKDLNVEGSSADISVSGRVGFRKHDYDQYVLATPHIGNSLPIVGAVVAGPVGAAAGLAVQGLLGKGLNKAASARYHITGSWDKPKIELVEKHVPEAKPPAPAPAASTARPAPATSIPINP